MNVCSGEIVGIVEFFGFLLKIVKISLPLVVVAIGTFDFVKIVVSGKYEELKKNFKIFGKRVIAAIIIFFIPTLVRLAFSFIGQPDSSCLMCFLDTRNCNITSTSGGNNGSFSQNGDKICSPGDLDCADYSIYYGN